MQKPSRAAAGAVGPPLYDGRMPLTLLAGPANAGKVARLLRGYLDSLDRDPVLIVPNRSDVDQVERELLRSQPALLGGSIGTFDDLFERLARGAEERPVASPAQRALVARRAIAGAPLNGLGPSARFAGFADALLQAVAELEAGLLDPADLPGDLGTPLRRLPRGARPARRSPTAASSEQPRCRPARVRLRRLARRARLRLRLRGPDRRGVAPARDARRPHRGHRLAAVRARPARVRVAPAHGRRPRGPRGRAGRGAAAALRRGRAPGARARRARPLLRDAPPARPRATAPSASSRARARGARSSSSARRSSRCCARARSRRGSASSARASSAGARRSRRPSARSGSRTWSRATTRLAATAVRPRPARAPALRLARRRPARPLRLPALAVLGLAAGSRRLRRGPPARARRRRSRPACSRRPSACAAMPVPGVGELRGADDPVAAVRELATSMLRAAFGVDSPQATDEIRRDLRTHESVGKLLTELDRFRAARRRGRARGRRRRARAAHAPGRARRRRAASPSST